LTLFCEKIKRNNTRYFFVNISESELTREISRLGTTAARLKPKGIDGGLHKRWSMWFNSKQRAKPYQSLKYALKNMLLLFFFLHTGAAWLSSVRGVSCWVKS